MVSYYESQRIRRQPRKRYITGEGLFSSLKKIITSKAVKKIVKDTAKDLARKGLNEAGKKGTELLVKKIIPKGNEQARKELLEVAKKGTEALVKKIIPPKGKGLSDKSKEILSKHTGTIPIEKYVKTN